MNIDTIKGIGEVTMTVIDGATGNVLDCWVNKNLVVNLGLTNLTKLLAGDTTGKKITKIGVGTNGTNPTATDTALTGAFTKAISGYNLITQTTVEFEVTIDTTEANGMTIREGGLYNESDVLFSRVVRSALSKTSAIAVNIKWKIQFA